jgi:NitT/TauT family transport system permease protein
MNRKKIYTIISILVWLIIWFIVAFFIDNPIFLPGPFDVILAFGKLLSDKDYYLTILTSLRGIGIGFVIGVVIGILFAVISYINAFMNTFIGILMKTVKSIPVASFIIFALFMVNSSSLSILISALIVVPIIYGSFLSSLMGTDKKLIEFSQVFRLSPPKKILYIYLPTTIVPLISACRIAIGYAFKSGVAAEIIGLIRGTIGNEIYKTKLYLASDELFAWTISIVIVCFICEKIIVEILKLLTPGRFTCSQKKENSNAD